MNSFHDPELDDVLQEADLRRLAAMLATARAPEPPLDDAFRTGLRRQLMQEAWSMAEGRGPSWWRRAFAPPGIAWAGAVAGLLLIAAVVVWTAQQQQGGLNQVIVASNVDGKNDVALQQPILVSFNQPMDRQSTENAVQITPATTVAYTWDAQSRTLSVTPTSGNLAPNTQYQVTIGPGARTANNQPLATPQTITFVTQSPAAPPSPTPRPTPPNPLNEKQLASLGNAANAGLNTSYLFSGDSASIYYVDTAGALRVVSVKDGSSTVIAQAGAASPALSPAGDRLAYIDAGKIEVLTFAAGKTDEITPPSAPYLVGWAKDQVVWAADDGIYEQSDLGATRLAPLPATGVVKVVSIAPDGGHAVFHQDQNLFLVDLTSGNSTQLGESGDTFGAWSPDGKELVYAASDHNVVADIHGATLASIPSGQPSWSSQDAILLGGDTSLFQVRPDASNLTRLSNGTYRNPLWAPDGNTFAFERGASLWVATAPALPPEPTLTDEAGAVVKRFMDARIAGKADDATPLLDPNGQKAYGDGGLKLLITGDPQFSRYYVLTQEAVGTDPDTVRFVVRLVLSHGKKDVSDYEETLVLVRDTTSRQFLIDQASARPQRELGKGPEVVSVDVEATTIAVTFDSDLDPGTVNGGVVVLDAKGNQLQATVAYANRVATISGLNLQEGTQYKLVVLGTVRDVQGHSVAAEYDLDVFGPGPKRHANHRDVVGAAPPSPTPTAAPT